MIKEKICTLLQIFKFHKGFVVIGHLTYLVLILLAGCFYLERIIYTDASYYIFKMLYFDSFNIEFGRYTVVLYEWPSYLAMKFGLSLRTIIFLLSVNTILVSYLAFILCIHHLKNFVCGFAILLLNFIGVASSFFYPISEINIGLIFCIGLFAWLEKRINFKIDFFTILIGLVITTLSFLSHPAVSIVLLFIGGYFSIKHRPWNNFNIYVLLFGFIILFIWKSIQLQQNSYESSILSNIKNFKILFNDFFQVKSVKYYFYHQFKIYYLNHLIFFFTSFIFIKRKQFLMLAYYILAYLGILCFYFVLYSKGESTVMMEKAFYPVSIFLFLPFLDLVVFAENKKFGLKVLFFILVVSLGFARFISASKLYTDHIQFIDNLVRNVETPKTVKYYDDISQEYLLIPWAIGVETLLYSALDKPENSKTVYFIKEGDKLDSTYISNPNTFLCVTFWPYWDASKFDPRYFKLPNVKYSIPDNSIVNKSSVSDNIIEYDETIVNLINTIKADKNWFEAIKKKAKDNNVSVDSMLVLDAIWLINQEKKK